MKRLLSALPLLFLVASAPALPQGRWLSAEDIKQANQNMDELSRKSSAAEALTKKGERASPAKTMPKNIVTYAPTEENIRREAEAAEQSQARARSNEARTRELRGLAEKMERDNLIQAEIYRELQRQEQERAQAQAQAQARARAQQQAAAEQEARLRDLEQQAWERNNQPRRPLNCFSYGGGFSTCQ
jgi:hypothetical protein